MTTPMPSLGSLKVKDGSPFSSRPFIRHIPMKFKIAFLLFSPIGIYVSAIVLSFSFQKGCPYEQPFLFLLLYLARFPTPYRPRFAMAWRQIRISIPLRLCTASSAMPPSLRDGSATNPHLDSASLRSASSRCVLSPYTDLQEQFCFQASLSSPVPEICAWLVISAGFPQLTDVDVE